MVFIALLIKALYRIFSVFPQRPRIAFLSRQSSRPFDFVLLEDYLKKTRPDIELVWACLPSGGSFDLSTMMAQLWYAATSRVCFVDGYVPAISIPPHTAHRALCIQVWHATGAIKKFGLQSLDTKDGRTSRAARAFSMHRGYDCIIAGFSGALPAFEEAFGYPREQILPLGLPRMEYLRSPSYEALRERYRARVLKVLRAQGYDPHASGATVLYAPTFRRSLHADQWLADAATRIARELPPHTSLIVSGHPIEDDAWNVQHVAGLGRSIYRLTGVGTIHALALADYVITDYSTIAFEAGLIGAKVLFYTPDIDSYRRSPGLNIDLERELPSITFREAAAVGAAVRGDIDGATYDPEPFRAFMRAYGMDETQPVRAVELIAGRALEALATSEGSH